MRLKLPTIQNIDIRAAIFTILTFAVLVAVSLAVINAYHDRHAAALENQAAIQAQKESLNKVVTQHDLDKQASISRLVSICLNAQQSYDAGTPKAKAGSIRPDCSVVE